MNNIVVIDDRCGEGKTTYMINYMKSHEENKYIYVTPFLDELKRIKNELPNFKEPTQENGGGFKLNDLKYLLLRGESIATTHYLFKNVDKEVKQILENQKYILVIDEVLD